MSVARIDVHHHLLPPQYVKELAKVGVVESGGVPFPQWKPEDSLTMMDRQGIDTAFLSVSSPGLCFGNEAKIREMARLLNEFATQCQARWHERFGFFATLPLPDVEAALAEIAYALDVLHADGIGLLSNYAGVYYDTALSANAHALSSLQQLVPASHMLLGTDYPFAPESEAHATLSGIASAAGLSEQEHQDIEGSNAFQLFPGRYGRHGEYRGHPTFRRKIDEKKGIG